MTLLIEKRHFEQELRYPAAYTLADPLEDVRLVRCTFESYQNPSQRTVSQRPTLRRLQLERCHFTVCDPGPVVLDDVWIDTAWIHRGNWGPQVIAGCAFKHVTVSGRITGSIAFEPSWSWRLAWPKPDVQRDPFIRANRAFYRGVDWALDISEAEFTGISFAGCDVPADLIRRDPETQAVVTQSSISGTNWREACGDSAMWVTIERFLSSGLPDIVLVAGKRSKYLAEDVAAIGRLRAIGAALPG